MAPPLKINPSRRYCTVLSLDPSDPLQNRMKRSWKEMRGSNPVKEENVMSRLRPEKLHVKYNDETRSDAFILPRRYTVTHSDATGDLFLAVSRDYDQESIRGFYTRMMRDEVLAEWLEGESGPELHLYCHVSGGFVFGTAGFRYNIFRRELPLVLEAICYGERVLFTAQPSLKSAPIFVHFHAKQKRYNQIEAWGKPEDYLPD
jgi:hypothetical protein